MASDEQARSFAELALGTANRLRMTCSRRSSADCHGRLLVAGMHFMEVYNFDIKRIRRCVIHYPAPDGTLYPFCTYNSGPCYREKIEKEFSVPLERKPSNGTPQNGDGLVTIPN